MSEIQITLDGQKVQALFQQDDGMGILLQEVLNQILEAQLTEQIGAEPYERTSDRVAHRNGHRERTLNTRFGKITLSVPQTRHGNLDTELFGRYQRSEQALLLSLMEMYVNGVSTRKVKNITDQLCGVKFSKSTVSELCKALDEKIAAWNQRDLEGRTYPFLLVDAAVLKVRRDGAYRDTSVLIAVGINDDGRREILGIQVGDRENQAHWNRMFRWLRERGVSGVELVTSDAHDGIKNAVSRYFQGAIWQRCQAHFRRNVLGMTPRHLQSLMESHLQEIFTAETRAEARDALDTAFEELEGKAGKALDILEEGFEDATAVMSLPEKYRKRLRTNNMVERLIEEVRRRERVIRIFPNEASAKRLVGAVLVEIHEDWITGRRWLKMDEYVEWKEQITREEEKPPDETNQKKVG